MIGYKCLIQDIVPNSAYDSVILPTYKLKYSSYILYSYRNS
jgi:hypothetical protein